MKYQTLLLLIISLMVFACKEVKTPAVKSIIKVNKMSQHEIKALVDRFVNIDKIGYGYSAMFSGSQFLPASDSDQVSTLVLGSEPPKKSLIMTKIVAQGINAIPTLVKHLGDKRETKIPPMKGMMWMAFNDEYDFNGRVRKSWPKNVNKDSFGEKHPSQHIITVGDLCFVALGQIANRSFNATRYQPTGGLVINSPTYSTDLLKAVTSDYRDFTKQKHKKMLVDDFKFPDHEFRQIGAYRRLAFYYPDELEILVLKRLKVPCFNVFVIHDFVRNVLYKEKDFDKQKELYGSFIQQYDETYSEGVLKHLFEDLGTQEADEEGRLSPPLSEKYNARILIVRLFGYPTTVKSSDTPAMRNWNFSQKARFIKALIHDDSKKIDQAVYDVFKNVVDDDYMAVGCITRLIGRGYDAELLKYCERRNSHSSKLGEFYKKLQPK